MGQPTDETNHGTRLSYDSESDTATNSSDEFDWDYGGEEGAEDENLKAKRGRRLWLAFLKLARPIRVLLVGLLGVIILIIPLLVVNLRFRESRVKLQIYVWSLWLAVIWAASCGTYLVVDAIPPIVIAATNMIAGQAERLKYQLKVIFYLIHLCWDLKKPLVNYSSFRMAEACLGCIMGLDSFVHPHSCISTIWLLLGDNQ
jgi:hypothetical protein